MEKGNPRPSVKVWPSLLSAETLLGTDFHCEPVLYVECGNGAQVRQFLAVSHATSLVLDPIRWGHLGLSCPSCTPVGPQRRVP